MHQILFLSFRANVSHTTAYTLSEQVFQEELDLSCPAGIALYFWYSIYDMKIKII